MKFQILELQMTSQELLSFSFFLLIFAVMATKCCQPFQKWKILWKNRFCGPMKLLTWKENKNRFHAWITFMLTSSQAQMRAASQASKNLHRSPCGICIELGNDNKTDAIESLLIDCFRSNLVRHAAEHRKSVKIPISSSFASKIAERQFFLRLGRAFAFDSSAFDKLFNDSFWSMKQMHRVSLRHVLTLSWRKSAGCRGVRVFPAKCTTGDTWKYFFQNPRSNHR